MILSLAALLLAGCYALTPSNGGGQNVEFHSIRNVNPAGVALPPGYRISVVATELDFPTGVCFDDHGGVYVTESGDRHSAGRLVRILPGGGDQVIASDPDGSWNGAVCYHGDFYVSQARGPDGGAILKISPDGKITPLVQGLPSWGQSRTTGPVISKDGWIYFGQGAATNSGVVGPQEQAELLASGHFQFHDLPGADVTLTGTNFQTAGVGASAGTEVTGAYSPFGQPSVPGQTAPGQVPCTGAVMRVPLDGGAPRLVAWGFRQPLGLAFDLQGRLFATDQSYQDRGVRPVRGCGDLLWAVRAGFWYGWPDYWGDRPLAGSPRFAPLGKPQLQSLLADPPNIPPRPAAVLAMQAGAAGLDFSRNPAFGHVGQAFIAEFGDQAPLSGKLLAPVGFDVARVDPASGVIHVFAANNSQQTGPASKVGGGGLERPIAVRFDPAGTSLYVVDYGVVTVEDGRLDPRPRTGVLWKITREIAP